MSSRIERGGKQPRPLQRASLGKTERTRQSEDPASAVPEREDLIVGGAAPRAPDAQPILPSRSQDKDGAAKLALSGDPRARGKVELPKSDNANAFSMAPEKLAKLLSDEIRSAFDFAEQCKQTFTFFGGARVKTTDAFFQEGKQWGEAVALTNLAAAQGGEHLGKAMMSGLFSREACRAAFSSVLGTAIGFHGALELSKMLAAMGGLSSPDALAAAAAKLESLSSNPADQQLLASVTTTGAGPGMMEAVPLGVLDARKKLAMLFPELGEALAKATPTQGSRIELPFEQETSKTIERLRQFVHFLPRRLALTEKAAGFVVFPGGFGTMNELFEVLRAGRPTVLHSEPFWGDMIKALKDGWRKRGLVSEDEMAKIAVAADVEQGLPHLIKHARTIEPPKPSAERAEEMVADVVRSLDTLTRLPTAVTFIGGRNLNDSDAEVRTAGSLATRLVRSGIPVRIGGDGAVLRAVSDGARAAKKDAQVQALLHDDGKLDRAEMQKRVDVGEVVRSYPAHKLLMYENTDAVVALPGGIGTMDEVWEVACLMQCGKLPKRPLILVGKEFWQPFLDACEKVMLPKDKNATRMISDGDMGFFQVVDSDAEAALLIRRHRREMEKQAGAPADARTT